VPSSRARGGGGRLLLKTFIAPRRSNLFMREVPLGAAADLHENVPPSRYHHIVSLATRDKLNSSAVPAQNAPCRCYG